MKGIFAATVYRHPVSLPSYCDYSDERIDEIFAEKEARDDSRQFIEENGKKTLAQVFTDVRYPKDSNDMFSGIYLDFIREQGFEM